MDTTKQQAFEERLVSVLNGGALAVSISLGHRAGLFDAMRELPAATSADVAAAAGLNERYVREWLAVMVTGGVVEYEPESSTYRFPPEHAAFLTRAATPNNFAVVAQYIPLLGAIEDRILECFQRGGGVPYSEFHRFHEVMAEDSGQTVVAALAEHILPLVPGLEQALERGIDVADVGCGRGRALLELARRFPNSRFTGYDFSEEAIAHARRSAAERGLDNVRFEVRDAAAIDLENAFDWVTTFDAIHDQAQPDRVLRNICRMLRPNGIYLMQDIASSSHLHENLDHPLAPLLYTVSTMHCMTVSLAQGGAGLGTMWGRELAHTMLAEAGFDDLERTQLPHDPMNDYYVARKKPRSK
jgi:2-polyprenyl-3-methyl-5-hydroxy-6-metoxy-1,4-benzoquinol methylase